MTAILIVDDDRHIREIVAFALGRAGFAVHHAADGHEALAAFARARPALVVLDIVMPELDGIEVCRKIRAESTVPIVFLSSRDEEIDRIVGLELGGDDYVTKPFSPRELVARVRAVLRRTAAPADEPARSPALAHAGLSLDAERYVVIHGEREAALTLTEFGILRTLMARPGKVFRRSELMSGAYDDETVVSDRTIDSHVRRIRAKLRDLDADLIETVHGIGYTLR